MGNLAGAGLAFLLSLEVKGALLLGGAGLAALALRRASAAARHWVWSVAMGTLLLLPVLSLSLPPWVIEVLPAVTPEAPVGALARGASDTAARHEAVPGPALAPIMRAAGADAAPVLVGGRRAVAAAALGLWGAGALALTLWWILGVVGARRLLRRARPVSDPALRRELAELSAELGLGAPPPLLQASRPVTPMVIGLLRPALVLPPDAAAWPAERRRVVLLHELGHVRRRDCLSQALAHLACALHFWNPLLWLAARQMRIEREAAADDLVLLQGVRASSYAEHLLHIATDLRAPAAAVGILGPRRGQLERRVRALLLPGRRRGPLGIRFAAAAGAAALALALPLASLDARPESAAVAAAAQGGADALRDLVEEHLRQRALPAARQPGRRVELTLDEAIQGIVSEELAALTQRWRPTGASIIVLDPANGEVLGIASQGAAGGPALPAVQSAFEPASTIKPFTVAAALEEGRIRADQRFSLAPSASDRTMTDPAPRREALTAAEILMVSSNIGTARIYDALGAEALGRWLRRLHFGQRPAVEIPAAAAGALPPPAEWRDGVSVASGEGLTASPLQVAAAFAALANEGAYHEPAVLRRIVAPGGAVLWQHQPRAEPVLRPATAQAVLRMLEGVVSDERGTGRLAAIDGYRVAGKTGTGTKMAADGTYLRGRYYASFVGVAPVSRPRAVILVAVDEPQGGHQGAYQGGVVAAPAFRRVGARVLAHLGAPRDR